MQNQAGTILLVFFIIIRGPAAAAQGPATGQLSILLSNDDGYDAPGLRALIDGLRPVGSITVAAPAVEQSGKGHSITISDPIFVSARKQAEGSTWYAIDAPPATCVRLAVEALLVSRPDVVVSGVNRGANLGSSVYLSGTVGAAREAAIVGLPAIAVSMKGNDPEDYSAAAAFVRRLIERLRAQGLLKPGLFLNVNVPAGTAKGVRICALSIKPSHESFERRLSPQGRLYFWPMWRPLEDDVEGTDVWAFVRGFITVTPMTLDATAPRAFESLRRLELP